LALNGDSLDSERNPENLNEPETPTPQAMTRRERRELEAREGVAASTAAVSADSVAVAASASTAVAVPASKAVERIAAPVVPAAPAAAKPRADVALMAKRGPGIRKPRFTKRGAVSAVVMTFAAALIATMALPAYAFGGGGSFDAGVATDAELSGAQTLIVPDASAALAVSRDNYKAPTSEELASAREAAAAAVAATEAATAAANTAATTAAKGATASSAFTVNPPSGSYSGAAIVAFAEQFVGVVPYGSGASPDTSFGCDGLTQYVFGAFGIYLPRTVSNQAAMGIPISPADAQAGDLMIYPIGHVGIYAGDGTMIDSPDWGRYVEHRPVWGSYYFVRIVA